MWQRKDMVYPTPLLVSISPWEGETGLIGESATVFMIDGRFSVVMGDRE
jgi:hypothetical protein